MRKALLLLVSLCLSACVHFRDGRALYPVFEDYRARSVEPGFSQEYGKFFSKRLLQSADLTSAEVREQLAFGMLLAKTKNYFQSPDMKCLTVNGFTGTGEPIAFNLLYDDQKIDLINISYMDSEGDFPRAAICPDASG